MNKHIAGCLLVLAGLLLGATAHGAAPEGRALVTGLALSRSLDRDLEPVIVTGAAVGGFRGLPVDEFFAYAYIGDKWRQIPAQVDELTPEGVYTFTEDGLMDANDEIIFMVKDLGDQALEGASLPVELRGNAAWYEIEVADPLSPDRKAWGYLVHSTVLTPTFAADYVDFDPGFHRINAEGYSLGFGVMHRGADYLTIGVAGPEILDRIKSSFQCPVPILCPQTEESMAPLPDGLIRDGPVRAILREGQVVAYGSMLRWASPFEIPSWFPKGSVRLSVDFNESVIGSVHYSDAVPYGVTVDGIADDVPTEPLSSWWQLSTDAGTLIHVADTSSIGGSQYNYYADDSQWDGSDTGDRRHYGDAGMVADDPEGSFTHEFSLYTLPGRLPNLGATYAQFGNHPLSVTTTWHTGPRLWKAHLPMILNVGRSTRDTSETV